MHNILVIGDLYTETQFFVGKIPKENEFSFSTNAVTISGSKSLNAARVFSKQGNSTIFFGKVGNDPEGQNISDDLAEKHITAKLLKDPDLATGKISVITSKVGKSSIVLYSGANSKLAPNDLLTIQEDIKHSNCIYTSTAVPLATLYELVSIANYLGIPIFLDIPNQHKNLNLEKVSNATFFAPNRQETQLLTDLKVVTLEDAKKAILFLRKKIKATIIITLDKDGCLFLKESSSDPTHIPAPKVKSIDETASGDIFRAVFVSEWLISKNIEQSATKAVQVASKSTEIQGVNETINTLDFKTYDK